MHFAELFNITALTHSAATNMIFWTAGPHMWNMTLNAKVYRAHPLGEIRAQCSVINMAYDWIAGNFYLVCKNAKVVVCSVRSTRIFCSRLAEFDLRRATWIALDPTAG